MFFSLVSACPTCSAKGTLRRIGLCSSIEQTHAPLLYLPFIHFESHGTNSPCNFWCGLFANHSDNSPRIWTKNRHEQTRSHCSRCTVLKLNAEEFHTTSSQFKAGSARAWHRCPSQAASPNCCCPGCPYYSSDILVPGNRSGFEELWQASINFCCTRRKCS